MMQGQKVVIWGTGRFARLAYDYYKDECNILFFTDSNRDCWNKEFCSLPVKSPDELKGRKVRVILAFQSGRDSVKNILNSEYHIDDVVEFCVEERNTLSIKECGIPDENSVVVAFNGGLGNQLFQFALLYDFYCRGIKTFIDVSYYNNSGVMDFSLPDAFELPPVQITDLFGEKAVMKLINANHSMNYLIYKEPTIFEQTVKRAEDSLLHISGGYLKGMFQSYYYIKRNLVSFLEEIRFKTVPKILLEKIERLEEKYTLVSLHIRRGDYLTERNRRIYGNICTAQYYRQAIAYIRSHVGHALFLLFSDDMSYVEKEYQDIDFVCIGKGQMEDYRDWYDMYLMSRCKHNIIANSTFSWWGAVLNRNQGKIVIAPSNWVNGCKYEDIYPEDWITIDGQGIHKAGKHGD